MRKYLALLLSMTALLFSACGGAADSRQQVEDEQSETQQETVQPEEQEEAQVERQPYRTEELILKNGEDDIYGIMYLPITERTTYPTVILSHGFGGNTANSDLTPKSSPQMDLRVMCLSFAAAVLTPGVPAR